MIHSNISVNCDGHLTFAGYDTVKLAKEYGTPLYLYDAERIRERMRTYVSAITKAFPKGSMPLYAGKAASFKALYRICNEEGLGTDVVSCGELFTAISAGFPADRIYFHGNNKTDADIRYAIEKGIGFFVVDNRAELDSISAISKDLGISQRVILRLTPGIDPHTFAAVNTGKIDCQFGTPIETGQAIDFVRYALGVSNIDLVGFHCHIGSQIFDWTPFRDATEIMLSFIAEVKGKFGYKTERLDLGGGFGIKYVEGDPTIDIAASIEKLGKFMDMRCKELGIDLPVVLMEPGRSIVADSGMTLYSAGGVKTINGYRSYVSVDGGMSDNPRYALYKSPYTVYNASKANKDADLLCTIAGRCCESGALIQENITIPTPDRNDIIAVAVTGAYNFSMSSNYNRLCRPPVIMLDREKAFVAVRRESFEDLTSRDI